MTLRGDVLDAVVAALSAQNPAPPSHLAAVHRYRFRPIDRDKLSAIVVYPHRNDPEEHELEQREDAFAVVIELRAKQLAAGVTPDVLVEELYDWTVSQLLADPTLGGLVTDLVEGSTQWQGEELDEAYCAAAVVFTATFHRPYDDPSTPA